jgi:hypothetical protein
MDVVIGILAVGGHQKYLTGILTSLLLVRGFISDRIYKIYRICKINRGNPVEF